MRPEALGRTKLQTLKDADGLEGLGKLPVRGSRGDGREGGAVSARPRPFLLPTFSPLPGSPLLQLLGGECGRTDSSEEVSCGRMTLEEHFLPLAHNYFLPRAPNP